MQTEQIVFSRLLLMLSAPFSRYLSMAGRNLGTSRKGVWLYQPGEGRDSWSRGMGQAEADGAERLGWRGDRWQHRTAREGGHMATWDWQEHKSLHWSQLWAWWVWIRLGEGKRAFTSSRSSSDMDRDPWTAGCGHGCVLYSLDRDVSHWWLLSLHEYFFCCHFSI